MQSTGPGAPIIGQSIGRRSSDVHVQAQERHVRDDGEPRLKLLVVCFGNTCRSPMAGGLAGKIAAEKGIALEVQTAGVAGHHKGPVASLAVDAMRKIDVDISQDYSKPVTRSLIEWADVVVTVERDLALGLRHQYPDAASKILHLNSDVPDPRRPQATFTDYANCRDLLEELLSQLPIWH